MSHQCPHIMLHGPRIGQRCGKNCRQPAGCSLHAGRRPAQLTPCAVCRKMTSGAHGLCAQHAQAAYSRKATQRRAAALREMKAAQRKTAEISQAEEAVARLQRELSEQQAVLAALHSSAAPPPPPTAPAPDNVPRPAPDNAEQP